METRIPNVRYEFFGRQGGTSPRPWDSLNTSYDVGDVRTRVDENRSRIAHKMGVPTKALYTAKQVHGVNAIRVRAGDDALAIRLIEADALWTTDTGVALGIQTADCVPVLFASKGGRVVGGIHAGWRGVVAQIAPTTIAQVGRELGIESSDFAVVIGPCAGPDKFELEHQLYDMAGVIEQQLQSIGVNDIEIKRRCTMTETDTYFSHRVSKGRCGRQLSVIALMPLS